MTAASPTSGERDLEALRRAQRAHEPSMEEILASIRSIISDERDPAPPRAAPASSGPQIVYSNPGSPGGQAAAVQPPYEPSRAANAPGPTVVWDRGGQAHDPEPAISSEPNDPSPQSLLSPQADEAVTASFNALSASVALHSAEMIEGMMREMLRPMLKSWLDDNLPSLVERLVRAEIQRVARGGR
jgi:cell pole-organizing protein PopZ